MRRVSLIVFVIINVAFAQIDWHGNWAMQCDFKGNDFANGRVRGEDCSKLCEKTNKCTHYTWTTYNGGTCWMKYGSVTKSDAFKTNDPTMVCGLITGGNSMDFRVINNCPYTIWPGIQGKRRSDPNWRLPFNGGWELVSGAIASFSIPSDYYAGRIWARTNCRDVNGRFQCETGDCGFRECAFDGVQRGGQPPASLAEFTLNGSGNQDFYDVSLVDGYNLKIQIIVRSPNSDGSGPYWCKNPGCIQDLNAMCPEELKKRNGNGDVIACLSACEKFNTDQYCCRNAFNTPQTCKTSQWPVDYTKFFKQACPTAYSYAYDDATSTFFVEILVMILYSAN